MLACLVSEGWLCFSQIANVCKEHCLGYVFGWLVELMQLPFGSEVWKQAVEPGEFKSGGTQELVALVVGGRGDAWHARKARN